MISVLLSNSHKSQVTTNEYYAKPQRVKSYKPVNYNLRTRSHNENLIPKNKLSE